MSTTPTPESNPTLKLSDRLIAIDLAPKAEKIKVILLDQSTGDVSIFTVRLRDRNKLEEHVNRWCDARGIRLKDCSWMEMQGDITYY